ncbi:IS110 family transposase [Pedobacter frigiditerrae]|uniref:IS110 family transposase n=1 Tax=Pedobacter frigiditerrae TaxID=2530452 RepID=UPI002931781A|nr:IS110 family transposase [Pedobacter frigiditerrae]
MTTSKTWRYKFFIGIDVSKLDLDIAIMNRNKLLQHYKVGNNPMEINAFIKEIKITHSLTIPNSIFGMEQTGIYCNHLLYCLEKLRANVVLDDANHIKSSLGMVRGKTDKADAIRIAGYLVKGRDTLKLWNAKRPILNDLSRLSSLRDRLVSVQKVLATPLKEERSFINKASSDTSIQLCSSTLNSLKGDIGELEKHIEAVWKNDERLDHLMELITSVSGVGPITALQIIIATNEFKTIADPRKFACYCGVAPFEHTSGTSVRKLTRVSSMSNRKLKSLLHSCALSARRHVPEIKAYYERKKDGEGKHKMSVMNAIRFKIIGRVFACVNNDRPYIKEYQYGQENKSKEKPLLQE